MLSWPFGMAVHHPVERNRHICMYSKKIFVRGVVRGIDFEKSLLERLSPEGGQNWHKLPSHMSYNMHKSNKNTSLAHHSGRKQGFLSTSPPTLNGLTWPAFKATYWDRLALGCQLRGEYDKITCFHPLEHFLYHIQSFEVQESSFSHTFWTLRTSIFSKWPKMIPPEPLPTPTNPPILGQPVKIFKFRKKQEKVH